MGRAGARELQRAGLTPLLQPLTFPSVPTPTAGDHFPELSGDARRGRHSPKTRTGSQKEGTETEKRRTVEGKKLEEDKPENEKEGCLGKEE